MKGRKLLLLLLAASLVMFTGSCGKKIPTLS